MNWSDNPSLNIKAKIANGNSGRLVYNLLPRPRGTHACFTPTRKHSIGRHLGFILLDNFLVLSVQFTQGHMNAFNLVPCFKMVCVLLYKYVSAASQACLVFPLISYRFPFASTSFVSPFTIKVCVVCTGLSTASGFSQVRHVAKPKYCNMATRGINIIEINVIAIPRNTAHGGKFNFFISPFLDQASYVSGSPVIVMNDEIRMARIKHGDMTIQHAFHQIPGGEPFIKRISSLNLVIP